MNAIDQVTILIIGIGIGYFWAMYRKDNIRLKTTIRVDEGFIDLCIEARELAAKKEDSTHV